MREINKCCSAFSKWSDSDNKVFATGNWGCGAFKGDYKLKFCIQWIAASICGRRLYYSCYDDNTISKEKYVYVFNKFLEKYKDKKINELYNDITTKNINILFPVNCRVRDCISCKLDKAHYCRTCKKLNVDHRAKNCK